MKTILIGDVHGCALEVDDLLAEAGHEAGDEVIFVGDLVAKGPDSKGVLAKARALGAAGVRGNHDEHCLRWWRASQAGEQPEEPRPEHRQVIDTLDATDWAQLDALPLFLRLPEHNAIVVHAGLRPDLPLEAQDPFDLMNARSIREDGRASKDYQRGTPWPELWHGPELVIFGHDAVRGLQEHPFAIGLDSGCVYGGELSALLLPERRIVSVPARQVWCAI